MIFLHPSLDERASWVARGQVTECAGAEKARGRISLMNTVGLAMRDGLDWPTKHTFRSQGKEELIICSPARESVIVGAAGGKLLPLLQQRETELDVRISDVCHHYIRD